LHAFVQQRYTYALGDGAFLQSFWITCYIPVYRVHCLKMDFVNWDVAWDHVQLFCVVLFCLMLIFLSHWTVQLLCVVPFYFSGHRHLRVIYTLQFKNLCSIFASVYVMQLLLLTY